MKVGSSPLPWVLTQPVVQAQHVLLCSWGHGGLCCYGTPSRDKLSPSIPRRLKSQLPGEEVGREVQEWLSVGVLHCLLLRKTFLFVILRMPLKEIFPLLDSFSKARFEGSFCPGIQDR